MAETKHVIDGWEFMANAMGNSRTTHITADIEYLNKVNKCIETLKENMNALKSAQSDAVLGGFAAEEWASATFNIDNAVKKASHYAVRLGVTDYASADIQVDGIHDYSLKYYANAQKSATEQAIVKDGQAKYFGQKRLIPTDQLEEAKNFLRRQELRNSDIRPDVSSAYGETSDNLVDRISTDDGIESRPLSKQDSMRIAKDIKSEGFNPEDYGYENAKKTIEDVFPDYFAKEALKAGCSSAIITLALRLGPELFKIIDHLINEGEIEVNEIIETGKKTISAGAQGFISGAITYILTMECKNGRFGNALKSIDPGIVASLVTIILETIKNSVRLAIGQIDERQMITSFVDGVVISSAYYLSSIIGGTIAQVVGFEFPGAAFLIGSLIGTAFCAVYQLGKKAVVSLCVNSGITFFGFVEQNYSLSDEMLNKLGIALTEINRAEVKKVNIRTVSVGRSINRVEYSTFDIMVLKRGLIGFNKVGYDLY